MGADSWREAKAIFQSLRPSDFAPAFGRAVAALRRLSYGTRERVPFRFVYAAGF
jgi:hypothetical protein